MPESSCLHIQDSALGPIRVLEISWPLVRVGRAPFCEVRLNDAELAAEVCRLHHRRGIWQIEPLIADVVRIDGRIVNGLSLLPFDTAIHIGTYRLTLHSSRLAAPDWSSYQVQECAARPPETPGTIDSIVKTASTSTSRTEGTPSGLSSESGRLWSSEPPRSVPSFDAPSARIDLEREVTKPISAIREQRRWESRWRAAGEKLRSVSVPKTPSPAMEAFRPVGTSRFESEISTHLHVAQELRIEPIPLKAVSLARQQVPSAAKVVFEPLGWSLPKRPARVIERDIPKPESRIGESGEPEKSNEPEVVTEGFVSLLDDDLTSTAGAIVLLEEPAAHESVVDRLEIEFPDGEEKRSSEEPIGEGLAVDLRPDSIELEPERLHPGEPEGPSVDARISAWNPSLLESLAREKEAEEANSEANSGDDDSRFLTLTEWIAPAQTLETITTCLDETRFPRPAKGYTASIITSEAEGRAPSSRGPGLSVPEQQQREPTRSQVAADSMLVRESRLADSRGEPRTRRPSELVGSPGSRSSEDSARSAIVELPSVDDIMAAHGRLPSNADDQPKTSQVASATKRPGRAPILAAPSLAMEPECWELPLWLGWPPLAFVSMLIGVLGCALSWTWMQESRNASIIANRLLGKEAEVINGRPNPLPEWVVMPSPNWYRSTPRHLTNWAAYLGRSAESNERADEIRDLLAGALAASPAYAPARLSLARIQEFGGDPARTLTTTGLGLSRDPIALAWAGRGFLKSGRKDVALPLYRKALLLAIQPELTPETKPTFADGIQGKRYLLPGEEVVGKIVAGLVSDRSVTFSEWSSVLPEGSVAPLIAARLLKEQNRRDSEAALDMILGRDDRAEDEGPAGAIRHAVRAEAFAMRANWKDAEREYYAAIDRIDHDATHRSWWYNLAEIEHRLKDDTQRQQAIKKALASTTTADEIARRAADLRRGQATSTATEAPRVRGTGLKAN